MTINFPHEVGTLDGKVTVSDVSAIGDSYTNAVNLLQASLNGIALNGSSFTSGINPVTGNDYVTDLQNSINILKQLFENGEVITNASGETKTVYMTQSMADNLNLLLQTLQLAGYPLNNGVPLILTSGAPGDGFADDYTLRTFVGLTKGLNMLQGLFDYNKNLPTTNRSIQAMIELDYVKTGNDMLADQLAGLQTALDSTKKVIDLLTTIQNLHNKISTKEKAGIEAATGFNFKFKPNETAVQFNARYKAAMSAYFGTGIYLDASSDAITLSGYISTLKGLRDARLDIIDQIAVLSALGATSDPASVGAKLKLVLSDIDTYIKDINGNVLSTNTSFGPQGMFAIDINLVRGMMDWLFDNSGDPSISLALFDKGLAGDIQTHITSAITTAESFNDTKKQDVQKFLFVFEEFYKSASAILQSITQIIQKIAQNTAR